jgi:hypothetical protein
MSLVNFFPTTGHSFDEGKNLLNLRISKSLAGFLKQFSGHRMIFTLGKGYIERDF